VVALGKIGQSVNVDLFFNKQNERKTTTAKVRVKKVEVRPRTDVVVLTIVLFYENTDNRTVDFRYNFARLRDDSGKEYIGTSFSERLSYPMKYKLKQADGFVRKLGPGLTRHTRVDFDVPRSLFHEDNTSRDPTAYSKVYFGFVSILEPETLQCPILIYDSKESTYGFNFHEDMSFSTVVWR